MSVIVPNLRVKMAERGWNIKNVKERTSLSRTTISNMYNFYSDGIKFDTLGELCDLFDCTPNDLLLIIPIKVSSIAINNLEQEDAIQKGGYVHHYYHLEVDIDYKIGLQTTKDNFNFTLEISTILKDEHRDFDEHEARLNFYQTNKDISLYLTYSENIINKIYYDLEHKINDSVKILFSSNDTPLKEIGPLDDWLEFLPSTRSI